MANLDPPDAQISYDDAIDYWTAIPATVDGVLGGFGNTSLPRTDVRGSISFLNRTKRAYPEFVRSSEQSGTRGCDVGAGIGRVTRDVLCKFCDKVDLVEPVVPFAEQIPIELERVGASAKLGTIYRVGMQDFTPEKPGMYWFVWAQWCLGQLTDADLVKFLKRCAEGLQVGGMIFVKENNTTVDHDEFDDTDSSVTRTDASFRAIFALANLDILHTEVQQGLPREIYPVRAYCLRPRIYHTP
ncbi:alpha N-terminal protein methyltransferase 1 [Limtongia smithiae]|uniref:alpha N-terminal protein methyltransferase 1 n=1 Tax=Limtongia smithiae TaxID=1125753 RepID=UPI0034CE4C0D